MRILFCSYRDWAGDALFKLSLSPSSLSIRDVQFDHAHGPGELKALAINNKYDFIAVVGWSWKIEESIVTNNIVIGMHPSKLPDYAGGSPIQNQIIDGLKVSEVTLFRLTPKFDEGPIIASKPYSLEGHLDEVLDAISNATFELFVDLINGWPELPTRSQKVTRTHCRLKPEQSEVTKAQLATMPLNKLWDLIRCREDPYPNVFIKDETGRLTFKIVEFESVTKTRSE